MSLWLSDTSKYFLSHKTQGEKKQIQEHINIYSQVVLKAWLHYFFIYFYYTWHTGIQALLWTEAKYKKPDLPLCLVAEGKKCVRNMQAAEGNFQKD